MFLMKKIFVVLPFETENYVEVSCNVAHDAELLLDTYLHITPDPMFFSLLSRDNGNTPLYFLYQSLGYILSADIVVFAYGWKGDRECSLLHAIAVAYGLNILDMEEPVGKLLKGSGNINSCPFCKSSEVSMCKLSKGKGYAMHCDNCGANGSVEDTEQGAVDAWNKGEEKHV